MTNGQTQEPEAPMEEAAEDTGGVSGMVNLTINLPDNIRISTVDDSQPEPVTPASSNATGTIVAFAGGTAPEGWLLCNGAAVSRTTYADLFTLIGTDYGVGNGNTTFNLPDLRGRFPLGKDDMGGVSADRVTSTEADALGNSGGAENHTLTVDELASHSHTIELARSVNENTPNRPRYRSENAREGRLTSNATGGDQPHNNMPPYQTLNYIIKT